MDWSTPIFRKRFSQLVFVAWACSWNRERRLLLASLFVFRCLPVAALEARADEALAGSAAMLRQLEREEQAPQQRWRLLHTDNYRILHMNERVAQQVAAIAERERDVLWRAWTGKEPPGKWPQSCDIYLYPSHREMIVMTGGEPKAGSTLVQPSKLYHGRILSRRVNLTADDRGLLDSTLPHEVSHLVFGDLFAGKVPLWINEGAATMAEGPRKQRYYERVLLRFLKDGRLFRTADLVQLTRYPDFPDVSLFYAQSSALVAYLLSLADGPTFIEFVGQIGKRGHAGALRAVYGFANLQQLHLRWLSFVKGS
jgi:hypothetical protein